MPETRWNIEGQLPKSYDGSDAFRCDNMGRPDKTGSHIKWFEKTADGIVVTKTAKIVYPQRDIDPIDLDEMRRELRDNDRYDVRNARAARRMRQRLQRIFAKMGVQYMDALQITKITPEVDICNWGTNDHAEYVLINPYVLSQRVAFVEGLLKKQILHRALARGRDNLTDRELAHLVFDICANRIMASTTTGRLSKSWIQLCKWLFPEESKTTILALCNASLTPREVSRLRMRNPKLADLWEKLYEVKDYVIETVSQKTGRKHKKKLKNKLAFDIENINPDDLYFTLKEHITEDDRRAMESMGGAMSLGSDGTMPTQGGGTSGGMNPAGQCEEEVGMPDRTTAVVRGEVSSVASDTARKSEEGLRKSMIPKRFRHTVNWRGWSDCRTEFWDRFVKSPDDIYDPDLNKYAKRIHTERVMQDVSGSILDNFEDDTVLQVYPHYMTEEGIMLNAVAFNKQHGWPFFWNYEGEEGRRRVVVFFDLSPSMCNFFTHMMYMCDTFENQMDMCFARNQEGDPGVMSFAGSVRSLTNEEIAEMRRGEIEAGASTCFNEVVKYCCEQIDTSDVDAVIMFTDGESAVSQDLIDQFNQTGKRMYRIYMIEALKENRGREIKSDLDFLNGESYTLHVPQTDKVLS